MLPIQFLPFLINVLDLLSILMDSATNELFIDWKNHFTRPGILVLHFTVKDYGGL